MGITRRTAIGIFAAHFGACTSLVRALDTPLYRTRSTFNDDWKFMLGNPAGASDGSYDDSSWRVLRVPHDWSIELPFVADNPSGPAGGFATDGIGWYRKSFTPQALGKSQRLVVEFDGIYENSSVWLNGTLLGSESSGFTGAQYDLTPYLISGSNVLAVRVDNSRQPNLRWYSGSGIYRNVWLTTVSALGIDRWGVSLTFDSVTDASATVSAATLIFNQQPEAADCVVTTSIYDPRGRFAASVSSNVSIAAGARVPVTQYLTLISPSLWSPESPSLYMAYTTLSIRNGPAVDGTTTPFGVRTFVFDPNHGFSLNGTAMKLKGVCLHQDGGAMGSAVPVQVLKRRLGALKSLGCNAVRLCHNPPAPELLDLLDQMGFLAIVEAFDKWDLGYAPAFESPDFASRWPDWLLSMLKRDRNHPSVIMWSVGNETGLPGTDDHDALLNQLVNFVHTNEPTRPVMCALVPQIHGTVQDIANSVAKSSEIMDVMSVNYQEQFYDTFHAAAPDRPIIGTEAYPYFRGVPNGYDTSNPWFDCASRDFVAGHFVWAGVDYLGESAGWPSKGWPNALIDSLGRPKPFAPFFQSIWRSDPMVHAYVIDPGLDLDPGVATWRWPSSAGHWNFKPPAGGEMILEIHTPSNCDTVLLFVNDQSYGALRPADFANGLAVWYVRYAPGTLTVLGLNGGTVAASFVLQTTASATAIVMTCDFTNLSARLLEVCHVDISIVDAAGMVVPDDDRLISLTMDGPGTLLGVDSGDMRSSESFRATARTTYLGRALAVIQASGTTGDITLTASAPGLTGASVRIHCA